MPPDRLSSSSDHDPTRHEARVAVAPNKYARGFQAGQEDAPSVYAVRELRDALTQVYATDAHLVTYLVDGLDQQPRVNKPGLELYGRRLTVECFFCDVDNPGHTPWTAELFEAARAQDVALPSISTAGIYYTRGGRRIVQPLPAPLEILEAEDHLCEWLRRLESEGLAVDWRCRDWTRHYRLPNVPREPGRRSRCVDLARMRPIALPPLPPRADAPILTAASRSGTRAPRTKVRAWTDTLPEPWRPVAARLARAVVEVTTEWHSLFMALGGALLSRGLPPEHLPALSGAISTLTGRDDRTVDRVASARTTVERWQERLPVTGYATLVREWPGVADALDEAFATAAETRLREQARAQQGSAKPMSVEETKRALEDAIARAPPGLTLIKAECGLGKTQAALRVAAQRAKKLHAHPKALGTRAPAGSRTAVSVDKNRLAQQCVGELARMGQQALRVFGPLSLFEPDGTPVCRLHEVASPLVAGGQRMQWELCEQRGNEKCPHYDGCRARPGFEGPEDSRITIGSHALISELDAAAGKTGLLVIDEIQDFLETTAITDEDLRLTLQKALLWFDGAFVGALEPAVRAMQAFLASAPLAEPFDACEAARRFQHEVPLEAMEQARRSSGEDGDIVDCAVAAPFPRRHHGTVPPILRIAIEFALMRPEEAWSIGRVSRVLRTIHHALASEYPVKVRVEERAAERVLLVTAPREPLARALRRDGSVVVIDANVDLHAPVLSRIVGYEPPFRVFSAPDGAPIERTMIRTRHATRKAWFKGGRLVPSPTLVRAVQTAVDWAREDGTARVLGIITLVAVEVAIRFAAGLDQDGCRKSWKDMGQPARALDALGQALAPVLAGWRGTLLTAHYGAIRGLNDMAAADALVTLGDPWMNLGDAMNDAAFLGLGDDWEARYEARCRAELEQAHGRLRTVHRRRPGRALHVGAVLPGGLGWSTGNVLFRQLDGGRPRGTAGMTAEEFAMAVKRLGGVRAASRVLGCGVATVARYVSGDRAVPDGLAAVLARASDPGCGPQTVPETP